MRDFGDGGRVTFTGDFDVVVVDDFGWVVAKHEDFIGGAGNEEEVGLLALVGVFLTNAFNDTARSLAGDHKLIMLFAATGLERNDVIMVHLLNGEKIFGEGDFVFEFTGVKIWETKNTTAVCGGLFFVVAALDLYVIFVHASIIP